MPRRAAAPDEILTTEELAAELKIPEGTLGYWRSTGRGPAWFRPGGRQVRYRRSEVNRWLAECGDTTLTAASAK